jgi:hypothetical protein
MTERFGWTQTLSFCLATLIASVLLTKPPQAVAATAPVAYVYVQTAAGVNVYDASPAGQLTVIKGSPFSVSGLLSGDNGKYLIGVGTDDLHVYSVAANGAVGKQVSQISTQVYGGSECGDTDHQGALLDHTGKYLYVSLAGYTNGNPTPSECAALQTYKLAANGTLTFVGDTEDTQAVHQYAYPIPLGAIASNDQLAYTAQGQQEGSVLLGFKADSAGAMLLNPAFSVTYPPFNPSVESGDYAPQFVAADPAGHLAVVLNEPFSTSSAQFLASFSINPSTGAITSTNTYADMPTTNPTVSSTSNVNYYGDLRMSPSGKLLAVAGGSGLQFFHFNGAAPITPASGLVLPAISFGWLSWDDSNHLYALSYNQQQLYVLTVTSSGVVQAPGSPYSVKLSPVQANLIVVPK